MSNTFPPTGPQPSSPVIGSVVPYEQLLSTSFECAMNEGGLFFEGRSKVQKTLWQIAKKLDELNIPYAVVGNIALFLHGFRQYTDDVELLVRPSGMDLHYRLDPTEYWSIYPKHADLKDQRTGTQIQFFLAGDRPRGLVTDLYAYPDPVESSVPIDGIRCLALPALVDMKLALGIAPNGRMRHLSDVQEATRRIGLPREFCKQLNPQFQNKFLELWLPRTPDDVDEH